jgi:hypothetical protein
MTVIPRRQQSGKTTAKIEMKAQEELQPDYELLTGDHDVIDGNITLVASESCFGNCQLCLPPSEIDASLRRGRLTQHPRLLLEPRPQKRRRAHGWTGILHRASRTLLRRLALGVL